MRESARGLNQNFPVILLFSSALLSCLIQLDLLLGGAHFFPFFLLVCTTCQ